MPVAVYEHPHDARRRLAEIGVSIEAIQKAVSAGHVARISCTENDPPFIPGIEAWRFVVRTLRDELLAHDWRKADPGNFPLVINDNRKINIVVETGDAFTRLRSGTPRTKSLKGLYTEAMILRNTVEEDLFPERLAEDLRRAAIVLEHPTWVLLIHINDDEYRAELSFPDEMDEGQITSWKERIFIPNEGDESGAVVSPDVEPGPEFDVPVRRKA
jgi:hypothetical protein